MTESTVPATVAPKTSFWEDVFDIFVTPAAVFRRRQNSSFWPPMLLVAISIAIIAFATFNVMQPVFDAEFTRGVAKATASNPQAAQASADMMNKMRAVSENVGRYAAGPLMVVFMFLVGTIAWLLGKLFGSKQTYNAALVVAAWSYMPRVVESLVNGVQGLLMDPENIKGRLSLSLGPARFMDLDSSNQLLLQLAGRLDIITIWVTVLLSVGLCVTGKVSKSNAAMFGVLIWILGSLPALRAALT